MFIGNKYDDTKLYRGIKHYDSLPLTSDDIHEATDTSYRKNSLFLNNVIGQGVLNEPAYSVTDSGIVLSEPSVVLIDGDISLIQSTSNIVDKSEIGSAGYTDGTVCIVGWYQPLTYSSTLRAYGGVRNTVLENDLMHPILKIQVSTRYQLRWDVCLVDTDTYHKGDSFNITLPNRDDSGSTTSGTYTVSVKASTNVVRTADKPSSMTYAESNLYIVPILSYHYENGTISNVEPTESIKIAGDADMIVSTTEPADAHGGAMWYNPDTSLLKFYVKDVGFISVSSEVALMQYHNTVIIEQSVDKPSNIDVSIGISSYEEGDILQIIYNGAVLGNEDYSIDYSTKTVTLLGFTSRVGDSVIFLVTKIINTNTATSISSEFNLHASIVGDSSLKGHLSLSDTANQVLNVTKGIAATPKAVYDATTLTDTATNKKYRLKVTNGVLGIVEV